MSCCGGLNQILTLNVPGVDQTEGTPLDVSGLVGDKSIEISGNYNGSYTILGSNDGVLYVPLLTFNSGSGSQAFKQTTSFIVNWLKVRRRATNLSGPVSIVVAAQAAINCAGSGSAGANQFIQFNQIPVGAQVGPGPTVDLWALVSATGLDPGFNVMCGGKFVGTIVIEGSNDGVQFTPVGDDSQGTSIGGFTAGSTASPQGNPTEFSPLIVDNVVRYLRTRVATGTRVMEPVSITLGGSQNCAGTGGGGGTVTSVNPGTGISITGPAAAPIVNLANVADQTFLGNDSGVLGPPTPLTTTQVKAMLFGGLASGVMGVTTGTGVVSTMALTGLQATGTTLTNNVVTGLAGGQTWNFGTAAADSGTILSTTAGAPTGHINLGANGGANQVAGFVFYPAFNAFVLGWGSAPITSAFVGQFHKTVAGNMWVMLDNDSAGTTSTAGLLLANSHDLGSGSTGGLKINCQSFTTVGIQIAGGVTLSTTAGNLVLLNAGGAGCDLVFATGAGPTEQLRITNAGILRFGAAMTAANGAQVLTIGATGPAGIGTTTPFEYMTAQDSSSNTVYWPVWH
jgi:hypothetical protein